LIAVSFAEAAGGRADATAGLATASRTRDIVPVVPWSAIRE